MYVRFLCEPVTLLIPYTSKVPRTGAVKKKPKPVFLAKPVLAIRPRKYSRRFGRVKSNLPAFPIGPGKVAIGFGRFTDFHSAGIPG